MTALSCGAASRGRVVCLAVVATVGGWAAPVGAQISVTGGTVYTQTFDSLPASGSATFGQFDSGSPTLPGVFAVRTSAGTSIAADNGVATTANLYSYGSGADRALGSLGGTGTSGGSFAYGVVFRNTDAAALNVNVQYAGEQWRTNNGSPHTASFSYITQTATPTATGLQLLIPLVNNTDPVGYTSVPALDFVSPVFGVPAAAVDGNTTGRQTFNVDVSVNVAPNDFLFTIRVMVSILFLAGFPTPPRTGRDPHLPTGRRPATIGGGVP